MQASGVVRRLVGSITTQMTETGPQASGSVGVQVMQLFQGSVFSLLSQAHSPGNLQSAWVGVRLSHLKPHSASDWPCGLRQLTEASPALSVFLCAVAMFPALSRGANRVPRACRALRMAPRT